MSELVEKAREAREAVQVEWSPSREDRVARALTQRLARERRPQKGAAALALAAAAVGALWLGRAQIRVRASSPGPSAVARAATLRLVDGSEVTLDGPDSRLETRALAASAVTLRVIRGGATFAVTHREARVFRVEIAGVAVQVLGTTFSVREEPGRVHVSVREGRVRVFSATATRDLGAGEWGDFIATSGPAPQASAGVEPTAEGPVVAAPSARAIVPGYALRAAHARPAAHATEPARDDSWRELARGGDFDRAYETLAHAGATAVRDVPEDLLLAADAARLSQHPGDALEPLRRVVARHASDPRAPLAAFTLGRVLLDELGRPREAARAFADAERLAPDGSLAEDALARQVEALARAGDASEARALAERYLARFADGHRARAVRRFGGLDR